MRFQHFFKQASPWKFLRRWSFFPLLFVAFQAGAQQVSLSVKEMPLEAVFDQIRNQTGYTFLYTSEELKTARPVTASFRELSLAEALATVFTGQPLRFSIDQTYVVVQPRPVVVQRQTLEIRGKVLDEGGNGIADVSVAVKGTSEGTGTDRLGSFQLKTNRPSAVLVFTAVGYQPQEVPVTESRTVVVVLKTAVSQLDEQVIIAYGSTTRRTATGTVSSVSRQEIQRQPVSNPVSILAGRVAGLQVIQGSGLPGTFYTLRLRGQNSIANGNDPLIIIDGIPFPSTPLNGSFGGGGGVGNSPLNNIDPAEIESIEVLKDADATAIYGSRGANGVILITTRKGSVGKLVVQLNAYTGWGQLQQRLNLLSTKEYLSMRREAFSNDGITPTTANARDLMLWDTTRFTDWFKVFMGGTMRLSDYKLSLSDGNQQTQFLVGVGYHKETTVLPMEFGEEKISGHFNVTHQTTNRRLEVAINGSFLRNTNQLPQTDISAVINLPPNAPRLFDAEGNLNWENGTWTNPMSLLIKRFHTKTENLLLNTSLRYRILPSLEFKTAINFNQLLQDEHTSSPIRSNNPSFGILGRAGFGRNKIGTVIIEPQLTYRRPLLGGQLSLLAGYTYQATDQDALYQIGNGYANDDLLKSIKAAPSVTTSNEIHSLYRYSGLFGRLNYDYRSRYMLTLTARRDGSSRYGPDNRFAAFGSVGAAWIFTRERFAERMAFLSHGKLKASLGVTGNDQIGDYRYMEIYSPYLYPYQGVVPYQPTQLYNPQFGWERVQKKEVGIDLGFLKDKLLLSANYYHNQTTNQLILYALPQVTGFSGVLQNLPATIVNSGWELEATTSLSSKAWKWTGSLNLTVPRNRLVAFADIDRSTYANTYLVGHSLFISRRYALNGVDPQTGNYTFTDVNKDGVISTPEDAQTVVFTGQQYFGGIQNTIGYKAWSLSFLFQFVRQKQAPDISGRFGKPGSMNNQPRTVLDRWRQPGDQSTVQKFSHSNGANNAAFSYFLGSDGVFSDASFIRLKNVELSRQFAASKKEGKSRWEAVAFLQGMNLLTFTGYSGLDPETKSFFPPLRIVTAGFRFTF